MLPVKFSQEELRELCKNFIVNNRIKDTFDKSNLDAIKIAECFLMSVAEINSLIIKEVLSIGTETKVKSVVDAFHQHFLQELDYLLVEHRNSLYNKHLIENKVRILILEYNKPMIEFIKFYLGLEKNSEDMPGGFY